MQSLPDPLDRREFDAATLMAEYPPRLHNANKQVVCDIASPPGSVHRGRIGFTRWAAMRIPPHLDPVADQLVLGAPGFFDYAPTAASRDAIVWHANFADPNLFVADAGGLFAQDEMQVAEHPALGALREAMAAAGAPATTDGPGGPTPILVTGVERRASVATEPDAAACRPRGLYGSAFAAAVPEVIRRATTSVDPPTITNLMAIAAIPGGRGVYRPDQIEKTLTTAFTGFQAAALESVRLGGRGTGVVDPHRLLGVRRLRWQPRAHGASPGRRCPDGRPRAARVPHRGPGRRIGAGPGASAAPGADAARRSGDRDAARRDPCPGVRVGRGRRQLTEQVPVRRGQLHPARPVNGVIGERQVRPHPDPDDCGAKSGPHVRLPSDRTEGPIDPRLGSHWPVTDRPPRALLAV